MSYVNYSLSKIARTFLLPLDSLPFGIRLNREIDVIFFFSIKFQRKASIKIQKYQTTVLNQDNEVLNQGNEASNWSTIVLD
jgi:hypothetical protein